MSIVNSSLIKSKHVEKRNFVRMQIEMPLLITDQANNKSITALCKNLSGNGIMFESITNFTINTKLEITLDNKHTKFSQLHAMVKVVRTQYDRNNNIFIIGAKIVKLLK